MDSQPVGFFLCQSLNMLMGLSVPVSFFVSTTIMIIVIVIIIIIIIVIIIIIIIILSLSQLTST